MTIFVRAISKRLTLQHGLGLDDHVVGRLLDRLGQEVSDRAETQQLDGEGHLMQGSAQNLGSRVFVQSEYDNS